MKALAPVPVSSCWNGMGMFFFFTLFARVSLDGKLTDD